MKKILSAILIACTFISLASCNKKEEAAPKEPANVIAFATHSYDKLISNIKPSGSSFSTDYTVYMLKGETEGCQLAVYSDQDAEKIEFVTVSGENEHITTEIFSMNRTHRINGKLYTDSTFPYSKANISLQKKRTLSILVEFKTTGDTPAGEYKYVFSINDASGKKSVPLATYTVTVHVWDITLPEEKTFGTSAGINTYHIGRFYGGGCGPDLYRQFYDMLLEHNVCGHTLPYDILDSRADAYMSDPRVTSFCVPCSSDVAEEKIIAYYNKIKENPVWLSKAMFYPIDEPSTMEDLEKYKGHVERLKAIAPEIPIISPIYTNTQTGDKADQIDFMDPYTDMWCPKLCLWDEDQSYGFLDYAPEKTFDERMAAFKADGDKMWSYVCNAPTEPYAQLFIDTDGIVHRLMMWQHYQRDIEGFLYWGTTSWGYKTKEMLTYKEIDPWKTSNNGVGDGKGNPVYGEGFLFYPAGLDMRMFEPISSIRMKILRDGIDDIEFFYFAEEVLGREWVMNYVNQATPSLTEYATNEQFAKLRIEMGNAVEAALAENK